MSNASSSVVAIGLRAALKGWFAGALCVLGMVAQTDAAEPAGTLKLLRYGPVGHEKPGLLDAGGNIRDLSHVIPDVTPAQLGADSLAKLRALDPQRLPLVAPGVRLGTPVNGIGKIVAVGLNYAAHAAEAGGEPPTEPILFLKATSALTGPDGPVIRPKGSAALDYEAELVIVIGKTARYVSEADAGQYIAGYAVGDDVSERDFQIHHEGQWTKGKSADTFAPVGPYLVSADGVREEQLDLWLKVNGQERQHANTRAMLFKPRFLVSYISRFMSLQPGDIIYSGTPEGVGLGMKPPVYLQPGDEITLGIEGLGEQRQKVVAWEESTLATDEDRLRALEGRRLRALRAGDAAGLQQLLADDYVHVHGNGLVQDRAAFIAGVLRRPRETMRGDLQVRIYGDLAVITGEQSNTFAGSDGAAPTRMSYFATQVAHREADGWRLVSMQTTPLRALAQLPASTVTGYPPAPPARLSGAQREVIALEERRMAAIAHPDFAVLQEVLADDYLHVYGNGSTSDRAGYIAQVRAAPRVPVRGPTQVRIYGDCAVVTGSLLNRVHYAEGERVYDTIVTQVAHKVGGRWKFVSFQITPKSD